VGKNVKVRLVGSWKILRLDISFSHNAPLVRRNIQSPISSPSNPTSSPQVVVIPTLQVFIHYVTQPIVQTPSHPLIQNPNILMVRPNTHNPWLVSRLKSLILPPAEHLGDLPDDYLKIWPSSNGENGLPYC
jgi:hypothetical protein